ncbi:hypothetical protein [Flavobacterium sp. MK4S-17]|uniref:hypothetical protein n=1 Tax=Flavobacterium sp. MK4S-17 TaxID=2543737 RepID=UPI001357865C|nr:hypothetical protein [Flavobacterium sp. MK4S-17]
MEIVSAFLFTVFAVMAAITVAYGFKILFRNRKQHEELKYELGTAIFLIAFGAYFTYWFSSRLYYTFSAYTVLDKVF